jgi:choice-of-anchor B domain-containing protein
VIPERLLRIAWTWLAPAAAVLAFLLPWSRPASAQLGSAATISDQACTAGSAGGFPCSEVDLLSYVSRENLGVPAGSLNDVWGWTDPDTDREYALVGLSSGTAFLDVTDPLAPAFLGSLPTQSESSSWRDVKVYRNYAVVVSEAPGHGMQIFDLTQLRSVTVKPVTFSPTAVYAGLGSSHNVFVNEATGYAYAVGSRGGNRNCGLGLHIVDLQTPEAPAYAGCFSHSGTGLRNRAYTHDVQCVVYEGPDSDFTGREICFGANETAVSIADVTDKSAPAAISIATYPIAQAGNTYVHQGWLTEDHKYFIQNDELDENNGFAAFTTTRIWDVTDLDEPVLHTTYQAPTTSIDHNLYVRGNWVYMANYTSGLRVVDMADISNPIEIAFFDTYPARDGLGFSGAWSTYPYFASGSVLISSIGEGLFVVRPPLNKTNVEQEEPLESSLAVEIFPNPSTSEAFAAIRVTEPDEVRVAVFDMIGRTVMELDPVRVSTGTRQRIPLDLDLLPAGRYIVRVTAAAATVSRLLTVAR